MASLEINRSPAEAAGILQPNSVSKADSGVPEARLSDDPRKGRDRLTIAIDLTLKAVHAVLREQGPSLSAEQLDFLVRQRLEPHLGTPVGSSDPATATVSVEPTGMAMPPTVRAKKISAERRVPMELMLEGVRHGLLEIPLEQASRLADCYDKLHLASSGATVTMGGLSDLSEAELKLVKLTDRLVKSNRKASQAWEENNKGRRSEYWARKRSELAPDERERRNEYMRLYRARKRSTPSPEDVLSPVPSHGADEENVKPRVSFLLLGKDSVDIPSLAGITENLLIDERNKPIHHTSTMTF